MPGHGRGGLVQPTHGDGGLAALPLGAFLTRPDLRIVFVVRLDAKSLFFDLCSACSLVASRLRFRFHSTTPTQMAATSSTTTTTTTDSVVLEDASPPSRALSIVPPTGSVGREVGEEVITVVPVGDGVVGGEVGGEIVGDGVVGGEVGDGVVGGEVGGEFVGDGVVGGEVGVTAPVGDGVVGAVLARPSQNWPVLPGSHMQPPPPPAIAVPAPLHVTASLYWQLFPA